MRPKLIFSLGLTVAGLSLPIATYYGGIYYYWINHDSGQAPDQGAMVISFLALVVSLAIGGVLLGAGIVLTLVALVRSRFPSAEMNNLA